MGRPAEIDFEGNGERTIDKLRIKQLKNHHRSMARDMVAGGLKNKELAKLYGMSPGQISIIVNSPVFVAEMARIETEIEIEVLNLREEIRLIAPAARNVLVRELVDEPTDKNIQGRKLQVTVAQDVLDRSGVSKGMAPVGDLHLHKHEEVHVHGMSDEALRDDVFDLLTED
jgi:hypothetical protein